ncbi:hypothetical protein [Caloramator australicus]|uniref:VrlQ n=1 Tax=Caloramator australicus RC3 TaxID=857293 RepID=I7KV54_9CLOT|nr:hypothetical protein [Caloramator australicus]CCJ33849.1 VrlQ [Caloramator australicus RC3]
MKLVGFLKPVKLEWLNLTVEELKKGNDSENIRQFLKDYISNFYQSKDTIRKAAAILMNAWVDVEYKNIRDFALDLYDNVKEEEKIALHYGLMMIAFPIFNDIVSLIGKALYLDERFKLENIKNKIYEKWGERQTLKYSIDRIIMSLKEWGLIENEKIGIYKSGKKIIIENAQVKAFLIACYLIAQNRDYIDIVEAENLYSFFPFLYNLNLTELNNIDILSKNNIGSNIVIGVKDL